MKRALLSLLGAGVLFTTLAHASTEAPVQTSRAEDASSLAVCIEPVRTPPEAAPVAPACTPMTCEYCAHLADQCAANCNGDWACIQRCDIKYSGFCFGCCY